MNSHQIVLPQVELQYSILDGGKYKTNILRIYNNSNNKLVSVYYIQICWPHHNNFIFVFSSALFILSRLSCFKEETWTDFLDRNASTSP